jgi:predicted dehydrogenase
VNLFSGHADLVKDPGVDIVYVATPVSHHFQCAMMAIEAGKAVLCEKEKAFTVTASQARTLVAATRAKGVFLMEAFGRDSSRCRLDLELW